MNADSETPIEHYSLPGPRPPRWGRVVAGVALISLCAFAAGFAYNYPPINWRVIALVARVRDTLNPPPKTIPTPEHVVAGQPTFALDPSTPTPLPTLPPQVTATKSAPTETPAPTLPPAPTVSALTPEGFLPTAPPLVAGDLPSAVKLKDIRWEPQLFNNCGPATLTEALTYWGWRGSEPDELMWYANGKDVRWQKDVAAVVKPGANKDHNVMPYELASYVTDHAGLNAVIRYGGDVDTIRLFVANGFPVIIERGFRDEEHETGQGWEGHYDLVTG